MAHFLREYVAAGANHGDRFSYTQTNYLLLKSVIEKVTATPFETYLRGQAFATVEPNRTIFSSNDLESIPRRAKNYNYNVENSSYIQKQENWGRRNNVLAGLNLTLRELIDWNQQ